MAVHDSGHIRRNTLGSDRVTVVDVTSAFGVLGLMGPRSRSILQRLAEDNLAKEEFPYRAVREVMVAGAPVRMMRLSYVGELGFELHVPTEYLLTVFDALQAEGREHGLVNAGYRAIDSLRLEKQFCSWGAEIGPDETPLEAGLAFAVAFGKGDFIGREALVRQRKMPLAKGLATFTVGSDTPLLGGETIYRDDQVCGWITSGGFGHTIGQALGLGYVRNEAGINEDFLLAGSYTLDVAGTRFPARICIGALYDPTGRRMRG